MLRAPGHPGLCFFHAEQNEQFINADEVAAELTTGVGEFGTPIDINQALGNLFKLVAVQPNSPTRSQNSRLHQPANSEYRRPNRRWNVRSDG